MQLTEVGIFTVKIISICKEHEYEGNIIFDAKFPDNNRVKFTIGKKESKVKNAQT